MVALIYTAHLFNPLTQDEEISWQARFTPDIFFYTAIVRHHWKQNCQI